MNFKSNGKFLALLSVGILAGTVATLGVSVSNAGPTGITACANKKTLVVELAKSGKCKSGYSKLTLGSPAPATIPSATTPASPVPQPSPSSTTIYNFLSVYDSSGNRLGALTFANSYGQWAFLRNGIVISASPENGKISDNGSGGYFSNSNCTGTIYWPLEAGDRSSRFISSDPLFLNHVPQGTTSRTGIVKFMVQDTSVSTLPASTAEMWNLSDSGACTRTTEYAPASGAWSSGLLWVAMKEIGRAQDFSGPLTIR